MAAVALLLLTYVLWPVVLPFSVPSVRSAPFSGCAVGKA